MTPSDSDRLHEVVVGLLRRNKQVLLCHRHPQRRWYPNVWDLPGGHVEPHEDPLDALDRELREELGIAIVRPEEPAAFQLRDGDLRLRGWIIDNWAGEPANLSPDEHDEIAWHSQAEVRRLPLAHRRYVALIDQALQPHSGRWA